MKPVGLTRAEEASLEQEQPARARVAAPAGADRCRIPVLPDGADCVAAATCVLVWVLDGDRTPACNDCALQMQRRAESNQTPVRIEPLK